MCSSVFAVEVLQFLKSVFDLAPVPFKTTSAQQIKNIFSGLNLCSEFKHHVTSCTLTMFEGSIHPSQYDLLVIRLQRCISAA